MRTQAEPDVQRRLQRYVAIRYQISFGWVARLVLRARGWA